MASQLTMCLAPPLTLFGGPNLKGALHDRRRIAIKVRCLILPNLSTQRRSANYQPTLWSHEQLLSLDTTNLAVNTCKDKVHLLEGRVNNIIRNETNMVLLLELVNNIQRLGLGYRFKNEIRKSLCKFMALGGLDNEATKSLHTIALGFRLLRQHGFQVSQDVFNMFKHQTGKFMESHGGDIVGMLSLYEASCLAVEGETVLDEAREFAILHLKKHEERVRGSELGEEIGHSLELPLHRRTEGQEARWSIDRELRERGGSVDEAVLELAVLDFNLVQALVQKDLQEVYRWWSDLDLASKLSFSRNRLMESFFWSIGLSPREPRYGLCRRGIAKLSQLVTTIDDVYDVYGTQQELLLFTEAVNRWDLDRLDGLPDYMKLCFLALYNTENDLAYKILKEQGQVAIPYLKKAWSDLCKAFLQEAKWVHDEATPSLEEYMDNGWRSVSGACILVHAHFMLGQSVGNLSRDLEDYHELFRWPSLIFRLCNDLATSSAELARGETVNAISCYMNQSGAPEEEAREHIKKTIDEIWKKMNKHVVDKSMSRFSEPFVETAINIARMSHVLYQHGDSHGAPDSRSKKRVQSLILEPISVTKQAL